MTDEIVDFRSAAIYSAPNPEVARELCVSTAVDGLTPVVSGLIFDDHERLVVLRHNSGFFMLPEVSVRFLQEAGNSTKDFVGDEFMQRHGIAVRNTGFLPIISNTHEQHTNNGNSLLTRLFAVEADCPVPPRRSTSGFAIVTMDPWHLRDELRATEHRIVAGNEAHPSRPVRIPTRLRLSRQVLDLSINDIFHINR